MVSSAMGRRQRISVWWASRSSSCWPIGFGREMLYHQHGGGQGNGQLGHQLHQGRHTAGRSINNYEVIRSGHEERIMTYWGLREPKVEGLSAAGFLR